MPTNYYFECWRIKNLADWFLVTHSDLPFHIHEKPLTYTISAKLENTTIKSIHRFTILIDRLLLSQMFSKEELYSTKLTSFTDIYTQAECN